MSDKLKNSGNGKWIRRRKGIEKVNTQNKNKNKSFRNNASQESLKKLADHFNNKRY